jgi:hypothetical protein
MAKKLKTILKCTRCPATADLSKSPHAWDGWQVLPVAICPKCIADAMKQRREAEERTTARLQAALALVESGQV